MKVLLYEPGKRGHCPTILRYTLEACRRLQIATEVVDERPAGDAPLLQHLKQQAEMRGCDLLHCLTLDGKARDLVRDLFAARSAVPIVGNYYLFSNLRHPVRRLVWNALFRRGVLEVVCVSDRDLAGADGGVRPQSRHVCYLPDPWWRSEFNVRGDIPGRQPRQEVTFLAFGELSRRKGIDLLARTWERFEARLHDARLVLAGRLEPDVVADVARAKARCRRIEVLDRFIEEPEIPQLFERATYIVAPYPAFFRVSSGTVTRAGAAGRPVIVPQHGVLGRTVPQNGLGLTFQTGSVASLGSCLQEAVSRADSPDYVKWCRSARASSYEGELDQYTTWLGRAYECALNVRRSRGTAAEAGRRGAMIDG